MAGRAFFGADLAAVAAGLVLLLAVLAFLARDSAARAEALPPEAFEVNAEGMNTRGSQLLCDMHPWACSGGSINVPRKLFFGDRTKSTAPCPRGNCRVNNTDPYYIEKVQSGHNRSSLRVTINDDADESLEVWGNSCAAGDCSGAGQRQHRLRADGAAAHRGGVTVGASEVDAATPADMWGFNTGLHSYNATNRKWSHFPWKDGINYLRGDVSVDGTLLAEKPNPGAMLERREGAWQNGDRYGVGQFADGRMRVYASSANGQASVGLGFAQPGNGVKDVVVATNANDRAAVRVKATELTVGEAEDPSLGVQVFSNGQNGASLTQYQGGLESAGGIGFRNRASKKTSFVHDTRSGATVLVGRLKVSPDGYINDQPLPGSWGGGLHTWDVYANATIGAGSGGRVASYINANGTVMAGKELCVGSTCISEQELAAIKARR